MNTPAAPIYTQIIYKHPFAPEKKSQSIFQERWQCLCSCSSRLDTAAEEALVRSARWTAKLRAEPRSPRYPPVLFKEPLLHAEKICPQHDISIQAGENSLFSTGLPITHWKAVVTFPKKCLFLHWLKHFSEAHEEELYKSCATRSHSVNNEIKASFPVGLCWMETASQVFSVISIYLSISGFLQPSSLFLFWGCLITHELQ